VKTEQNLTSKVSHLYKSKEKSSSAYDKLSLQEKIIFLAGIFDGEGSFGLWSRGKNRAKTLRCEVGTSDPDMVLRFQQIFGGHFYLKTGVKEKNKKIYKWTLAGAQALKPLQLMIPYMCLRRREKFDGVVKLIEHGGKNGCSHLQKQTRIKEVNE